MVKVEKRGGVEARQPDEDEESYSDQEDGVEIIDIQRVREMDWSAPEPLRKEKKRDKKKDKKVKSEVDAQVKSEKGKGASERPEPALRKGSRSQKKWRSTTMVRPLAMKQTLMLPML